MSPARRRELPYRVAGVGVAGCLLLGCRAEAPPGAALGAPTTSSPTALREPTVAAASGERVTPPPELSAPSPPASAAPHEIDWNNRGKPSLESEALTAQGQRLFEAVRDGDPSKAADFFFPRDPFLPLKDMAEPGRYWDTLFRVYQNDIRELHRKHGTDLAGAAYLSFTLGSTPTWVKPGEEANKIGYFRTFNGRLRYRTAAGTERSLEAKTIISWDGGWYVTHLLPIRR